MLVTVEKHPNGVVLVTLNRPEAMNALSKQMRREIADTFAKLDADPEVRAIVLTGAGKAFTAGLDLKELASDPSAMSAANATDAEANPVVAIEKCSKPVIGAINGVAITGGLELALACDILFAADTARFADTHARIGIMPGWGLSQKLSRMLGISRAKEMSLSGNFLDARTAAAWGLVNHVVSAPFLVETALKLAGDIATALPDKVAAYKRLIDDGFAIPYGDALKLERESSTKLNAQVTPDVVAKNREDVMARGRDQKN